MSYRINLNIINKSDFDLYDSKKGYNSIMKILDSYKSTELYSELDIQKYEPLNGKYDEYHPRVLNKEDFKTLLKDYQKVIYDNEVSLLDGSEEDRKDSYMTRSLFIEGYFERLIENDELISSSRLFILDYFYLYSRYITFDDTKDIIIITHG